MDIFHETSGNNLLVLTSIIASILSHFTTENLAFVASVIGVIAGTMAIINYSLLWYDRYKKYRKVKNDESKD